MPCICGFEGWLGCGCSVGFYKGVLCALPKSVCFVRLCCVREGYLRVCEAGQS